MLETELAATVCIVNKGRTKMLLVFHNKLQKWVPPGGHVDVNELPHLAAIREVQEELGIQIQLIEQKALSSFELSDEVELPLPVCILHEMIPETTKKERHMHMDFVYLAEIDDLKLTLLEHEVSKAEWFEKKQLFAIDTFPAVQALGEKFLLN